MSNKTVSSATRSRPCTSPAYEAGDTVAMVPLSASELVTAWVRKTLLTSIAWPVLFGQVLGRVSKYPTRTSALHYIPCKYLPLNNYIDGLYKETVSAKHMYMYTRTHRPDDTLCDNRDTSEWNRKSSIYQCFREHFQSTRCIWVYDLYRQVVDYRRTRNVLSRRWTWWIRWFAYMLFVTRWCCSTIWRLSVGSRQVQNSRNVDYAVQCRVAFSAIRAISTQPFWLHILQGWRECDVLREVDVGPLFVHYRQIPYARRGYCSRSDIARSGQRRLSIDRRPDVGVSCDTIRCSQTPVHSIQLFL
jgi:hypothetical protein